MGAYYFLSCLLPALPTVLGEKMPAPFADLSGMACRHIRPQDEAALHAHLSVVDAANWESLDQGREGFMEGGLLSRDDIRTRQNIPDFIRLFLEERERGIRRTYAYDRLWEICYEAILATAEDAGCSYLLAYVPWEIELRNRLIALRFKERAANIEEYSLLPGRRTLDLTALLASVEAQRNPLMAERLLDEERLRQIFRCEGHDPFSLDAILAYLARACVYSRWETLQMPYDANDLLSGGG